MAAADRRGVAPEDANERVMTAAFRVQRERQDQLEAVLDELNWVIGELDWRRRIELLGEARRLYADMADEAGEAYLSMIGDGTFVACEALIVGGWDRGSGDVGSYGVKLSLPAPRACVAAMRGQ